VWSIIISILYLSIMFWVVGHAFDLNISLSKTFIPLLYLFILIDLLLRLYKRNIFFEKNKYIYLLSSLIILSTISAIINFFRTFTQYDIAIFSFVIPFTLLFSQLYLWMMDTSSKQFRKILFSLYIFFVINAIVTVSFFVLINIFRIVDLDLVWNMSIQNTVLMKIAGQTWYRTPGIFEIGGTNGSFLLIFLSIALSKFYYSDKLNKSSFYLISIFFISLLIFFTLTRRTYLCMFLSVFLLTFIKSFKNFNISKIFMFTLLFITMIFSVFLININFEGIFSLDSLYDRFQFWFMSINNIIGDNVINLLIGLNVLQAALKHSIMSLYSYSVLDSGFIESIMYSGIIFTLLLITYFGFLLRDNINFFLKINDDFEYKWIPLFNIFMIVNMIVLMLFSPFIFNITESFVYLLVINYSTKFIEDRKMLVLKINE